MRLFLISCAFLALAACQKAAQPASNEAAPAAEAGPHKGIDRSHKGSAALDATFNDPDGKQISLTKFNGEPLLVNLWATWCAPCVKELPTLNKLDEQHADDGSFKIVAISQDDGPHPSVEVFLKSKAPGLEPYQDPKMALSAALGPDTVLPTSILYDANGKEMWRYVGDLDWTSPEAARLLAEAKPAGKR